MATVHPEEVVPARTFLHLWMYSEGLFTNENRPAADVLQGGSCYSERFCSAFILDAAVSGDAIAQVVANNLDDPEPPEMAEGLLANDTEQFQQELPVNTTEGCR